jgi:hypothetical protein
LNIAGKLKYASPLFLFDTFGIFKILYLNKEKKNMEAKITGIEISFVDLIILMVKISFATIPAMIIIAIIWTLLAGFFAAIIL